MHTSKHRAMLQKAHKPGDAANPDLDRAIRIIQAENPSAFLTLKDLKNRRFFHEPRPGTLFFSAKHGWVD